MVGGGSLESYSRGSYEALRFSELTGTHFGKGSVFVNHLGPQKALPPCVLAASQLLPLSSPESLFLSPTSLYLNLQGAPHQPSATPALPLPRAALLALQWRRAGPIPPLSEAERVMLYPLASLLSASEQFLESKGGNAARGPHHLARGIFPHSLEDQNTNC